MFVNSLGYFPECRNIFVILKMSVGDMQRQTSGILNGDVTPYNQARSAPRYRFKKSPVYSRNIFCPTTGLYDPVFGPHIPYLTGLQNSFESHFVCHWHISSSITLLPQERDKRVACRETLYEIAD
jgi:hypothetical protein